MKVMEDVRIHFLEGSQARPSDTGTMKVKTLEWLKVVAFRAEGFNFGEFKSGGLHEKHAVATWDLERIRLFK
jgi:hypothetical protein